MEHGGETSSAEEEGNQGHPAGTSSIMQKDNGEYEVDLSHLTSSKGSIFRIPGLLKMRNEQAYTPYKFSIGPWHFGKTQLLSTGQKLKESFLEGLLNRFPDPVGRRRELKETIKNVHARARECYEGGDVYDERDNMNVNNVRGKARKSYEGWDVNGERYEGRVRRDVYGERYEGPVRRDVYGERYEGPVRRDVYGERYEGRGVYGERDKDRKFYDERDNMDEPKEEFEKILLLDGCFIIELFRKNAGKVPTRENEIVLFSRGMMQVIYHDLLLLENQIPWFVLELLFEKTSDYTDVTLVELAIKFFGRAISHYEPQELKELQSRHDSNILHLVDFVWHFFCFSTETEGVVKKLEYRTLIPSATRLKEAGVKFQKAESRNILDVKFNKGVLEIPPLLITPSTETIIRNLIIFEQCRLLCMPRVTCYAILLDCLVDTSDDVDLMSRAGILNNWLNPEETANFLNRIRDNTPIQEFFYAQLCEDVNRFCLKRWPRWRASLIQNYFTKPWAIVSVVFAMTVLFFTIMQVFYK